MVALGADHGGFALKEELKKALLTRLGVAFRDLGTFSTEPGRLPRLRARRSRARCARARRALGILVDGAGIGSAMAANKVPGVRAALCVDAAAAKNAREHNDANVLTLGAKLRGRGGRAEIVGAFLGPPCTEERHRRRVAKITAIEESFERVTRPAGWSKRSSAPSWRSCGASEAPCACHAVAGGCCPDRMGRLLGHGAERFGLQADARRSTRARSRASSTTRCSSPTRRRDQIDTLCEEARDARVRDACA